MGADRREQVANARLELGSGALEGRVGLVVAAVLGVVITMGAGSIGGVPAQVVERLKGGAT